VSEGNVVVMVVKQWWSLGHEDVREWGVGLGWCHGVVNGVLLPSIALNCLPG
jgi:hypothetical protein